MHTLAKSLIALGTVGLAAASIASAQTVLLNDTFSDNERATQGLSASAEWGFAFNGGAGNSNSSLSASSGALVYSPSAAAAQYVTAYFTPSGSPVTIADGQSMSFTFKFTYTTIPVATQQDGLRFGLFNSNGSRYAAGFSSSAQPFSNLAVNQPVRGYFATSNPSGTSGTSTFQIREEFAGSGSATTVFGGAGALSTPAVNNAAYLGLTSGTQYTANFTITRSGTSASISSTINGITVSGTDTGASFAYDQITIFTSSGSVGASPNAFTLDDVSVVYSAVPEPSTFAALAGVAVLGLAALRRRRN